MEYHIVFFKLFLISLISIKVKALENEKILGDDRNIVPNAQAYGYHVTLLIIYYIELKRDAALCGGTIISGKHVLTAAHCVKKKNWADELYVVLPIHDLQPLQLSSYLQVSEAFVPAGWAFESTSGIINNDRKDFAVLKIKDNFSTDKFPFIKKLNLPLYLHTRAMEKGFVGRVLGRGINKMGLDPEGKLSKMFGTSDVKLRLSKIRVIPKTIIRKYADPRCKKLWLICGTPSKLDLMDYYGTTASGDSGGGLVDENDTVVGIITSASQYRVGEPSMLFFSNIWYHKETILDMMSGDIDYFEVDRKEYN